MFKYVSKTTFSFSKELMTEIELMEFPVNSSKVEVDNEFLDALQDSVTNSDSPLSVDFIHNNKKINFSKSELQKIYVQYQNYHRAFGPCGIFVKKEIKGPTLDRIMDELPGFLKRFEPRPAITVIYDSGLWPHTDSDRVCSLTYQFTDSTNWTTFFWNDHYEGEVERFKNFNERF